MKSKRIVFTNAMQTGEYMRTRPAGDMSDRPEFQPYYSPIDMLGMGVFEGKYLNSCRDEYPNSWWLIAKLSDVPDERINYFGLKSRKPTSWWHERNLIHPQDPRGWFEWYCRFYMGRRTDDDTRQINRWRAMTRHSAQVLYNGKGDANIRPRQRQTLLQWSYNAFPDRHYPEN